MPISTPFSLCHKTVLVTGASSGIGAATAIKCSEMGGAVQITGRDLHRLSTTLEKLNGKGHSSIVADLLIEEDVVRLSAEVPLLDGVVLCAGKGMTLPLGFATKEKIDSIFGIDFYSPMELLRLLVKHKKIAKGGSIVFVASVGGNFVFNPGGGVYGAAKAAFNAAMKFWAKELAPKSIRVNSVCPGMVETPLINRGTLTQEQFEADKEKYPLKRYGRPEDIANGIIYLLSDASSWVTGHSLVIDGGVSI